MDPASVERRLAAILSADVVGYSRLMADDEAATVRTLSDYREEIGLLVRQRRGRVVDTAGDSLLAEFPTALDAVCAAVEIQRVIQVRNADLSPERRMQFRIGVHLGDLAVEGDRIYGDGVNIAARLEGLAHAGGICISAEVHGQVRHKLDLEYEDLGEQQLKNIPDPVHVHRIQVGAATLPSVEPRLGRRTLAAAGAVLVLAVAGWLLSELGAKRSLAPEPSIPAADLEAAASAGDFTVPGFGAAPAIAVLPFDNLGGDPEQEYFADGLAEDLITRLSTWGVFPVIARNSSFTYKGTAVDVKQVSRELGVRYVVEGSVRKAAGRVRITAQLIDATSGHHVWAETYDRELQDIFALQDEITRAIGASMGSGLWQAEEKRTARRSTQSVDSYDYTMRGFWHLGQRTKEETLQARMLFQRAAELDPRSALALAGLASTHSIDIVYQWTDSPPRSVTELDRSARQCISLDDRLAQCQLAMCHAYRSRGQTANAIAACELAVQLNPSFASAYLILGGTLTMAGRPDEGIENLEAAMRLSPQDSLTWMFFQLMSAAHLGADRYQEAADWAQRSLQLKPDDHNTHALLAISYGHLGRLDEARAEFREVLRLQPDYTLAGVEQVFAGADRGFLERIIGGLRKAGLEE